MSKDDKIWRLVSSVPGMFLALLFLLLPVGAVFLYIACSAKALGIAAKAGTLPWAFLALVAIPVIPLCIALYEQRQKIKSLQQWKKWVSEELELQRRNPSHNQARKEEINKELSGWRWWEEYPEAVAVIRRRVGDVTKKEEP